MTLHESKEEERLPLLKYANPQVADNHSGDLFMRKMKLLFLPTDKITHFLILSTQGDQKKQLKTSLLKVLKQMNFLHCVRSQQGNSLNNLSISNVQPLLNTGIQKVHLSVLTKSNYLESFSLFKRAIYRPFEPLKKIINLLSKQIVSAWIKLLSKAYNFHLDHLRFTALHIYLSSSRRISLSSLSFDQIIKLFIGTDEFYSHRGIHEQTHLNQRQPSRRNLGHICGERYA